MGNRPDLGPSDIQFAELESLVRQYELVPVVGRKLKNRLARLREELRIAKRLGIAPV